MSVRKKIEEPNGNANLQPPAPHHDQWYIISVAIQAAKSPLGDIRGEHSALSAAPWEFEDGMRRMKLPEEYLHSSAKYYYTGSRECIR